nr:LuxR family transcriptional regulator [Blastococcus saxobsidens]
MLCLGTWEDDDRRHPGTDTEPLRLPPPLADRAALAAVQRLLTALAPTQSQGSGCGRLLAPDGRYEQAPMTALTLPTADIDLLSATAAALGHPRLNADIAELVDAHAAQLAGGYRRADRTKLVSLLARLAGLLDLSPTDDTRLLTTRLQAAPPGADCVLSDAEEAAHARTADRMNHIWAHGSGIDRYLY